MNPQLQAKWMEQGGEEEGRGGEVKGMVTSALSCQLEKWEEKTTEFSNQRLFRFAKLWPRELLKWRQMPRAGGSRSAWPCLLLPRP